jgi:hypothetical protein
MTAVLLGFFPRRQKDDEPAATTVVAFNRNAAAVRLDDVLDDREAESRGTRRIAGGRVLRESLKDLAAYLRRDAGSRIRYLNTH